MWVVPDDTSVIVAVSQSVPVPSDLHEVVWFSQCWSWYPPFGTEEGAVHESGMVVVV